MLRPIRTEELLLFYRWATQSDASPFWYGERCGTKIPTLEDFFREWPPSYFDGSQPENWRCFIIIADGHPIGEINYNEINRASHSVDIDILIAEEVQKGKGYGSDALQTLAAYLFEHMQVEKCEVKVIANNERAIRAYHKIGFTTVQSFVENGIIWLKMALGKNVFPGALAS